LTEALVKLNQTPLAIVPIDNDIDPDIDKDPDNENIFYIYIEITGKYYHLHCLKLKNRLANVGGYLQIELPIHPSTIEELALIQFWLLKLSHTHIERLYAATNRAILNPEFISVLNPRTGPRKILFHANEVIVGEYEMPFLPDITQFICARRIFLWASLDESHRNNIFKFITGTGNTLEKFRIHSYVANKGEFCEFLVNARFYYNSFLIFCFQI
jgi:hypothetical protein